MAGEGARGPAGELAAFLADHSASNAETRMRAREVLARLAEAPAEAGEATLDEVVERTLRWLEG
jgi:hypothetical protein